MNKLIYCALLTLQIGTFGKAETTNAALPATPPVGQTLSNLYWDSPMVGAPGPGKLTPELTLSYDNTADPDNRSLRTLSIQYTGTATLQKELLSFRSFFAAESGVVFYLDAISTHHYAVTGEVSYENVSPGSYLEMWSYFDSPAPGYPEGAYFSRTLADGGPMGRLEGTSSWREFWLPFDSTGTKSRLNRLEMNLHLTGAGTVHLRNMKLMQYPDAPASPLIHVPPASTTSASRVVLTLDATTDGKSVIYAIDDVGYPDLGSVQQALTSLHHNDPRMELVIRAERQVPYEDLNGAFAAAGSAGIQQVRFEVAPAAAAPTSQPPETSGTNAVSRHNRAVDWRSFFLGVITTTLTLVVVTVLIYLSRLWQRRQHERELRRIASLDS